jgi:2-methylcitrate dehydratase PrpD
MVDGEFSLPYCLAMILLQKKPGPSWYSPPNLRSKEVANCMAKIRAGVDPKADELYQRERKLSASVRVRLWGGKEFSREVVGPKGDMENPMSEKELVDKFSTLAATAIKKKSVIPKITEMILKLESLKNIQDLTSLLYKSC